MQIFYAPDIENTDKHYLFYAKTRQEKRDRQYEQGLGHLRNRKQYVGVLYTERIGIFGYRLKTIQERSSKSVGYLQSPSQKHGEDKEYSHFLLFEQDQRIQSHSRHKRFFLSVSRWRTSRQRERIQSQQKSGCRSDIKLPVSTGNTRQVDSPHGTNKTYRTPHANRWKIFHHIEPVLYIGHRRFSHTI